MSETLFKTIPIQEIHPDPNQPRKFYDELAMQELISSVKEKGVLQPILIRPNGKGYKLVCGERRYRASKEAGLQEIPAVVRELNDDEALELQIIENLQRKDVHPMEEAVAFKSLLENPNRKITLEEIAAKVGKGIFYVRQRIKLNSLSKDWQEVYYLHKIHTSLALEISKLAEKEQAHLFSERVSKKSLTDPHYHIHIQQWNIDQLQRKLKGAPFNTKDETLNPKMGACTSCPFNSAVASLFPDDAKDPKCGNATCYQVKHDVSFDRKLQTLLEDPTVLLVDNERYRSGKHPLIDKLNKDGHKVYKLGYDETYNEAYSPSKDEIKSGKVIKAFVVNGQEKGQHIYVKKNKSSTAAGGKKSTSPGTESIDDEIKRLKDREKRSKELDAEKVWTKIRALLNDKENRKKLFNTSELSEQEMVSLANAIEDKISYGGREWIEESFDNKKKDFEGITQLGLNCLFRIFIADVLASAYGSHLSPGSSNAMAYKMISAFLPQKVAALELEQSEVAARRSERVTKRISGLQKQKKELQQSAKPTTKPKKAKA